LQKNKRYDKKCKLGFLLNGCSQQTLKQRGYSMSEEKKEGGEKRKLENDDPTLLPEPKRQKRGFSGNFEIDPIQLNISSNSFASSALSSQVNTSSPADQPLEATNEKDDSPQKYIESEKKLKEFLDENKESKLLELEFDSETLPFPNEILDDHFSMFCDALTRNTNIEEIELQASEELTSKQMDMLGKAIAKNSAIKKLFIGQIVPVRVNDMIKTANFFKAAIIENPHLESLVFSTADFAFRKDNYRANFGDCLFKRSHLKKVELAIYNAKEFNVVYELLDQNNNIEKIKVECGQIDVKASKAAANCNNIYQELNIRLRENFQVHITIKNLHNGDENSCYGKPAIIRRRIFDLQIKRNAAIHDYSSTYKNLIIYVYAVQIMKEQEEFMNTSNYAKEYSLLDMRAEKKKETLTPQEQKLLDHLNSNQPIAENDLLALTEQDLNLLDNFLEIQLQFVLQKLTTERSNAHIISTENVSKQMELTKNFCEINTKLMPIKLAILKKSKPSIAAQLGKDIYQSPRTPPTTPNTQENIADSAPSAGSNQNFG
jgi:hypothetical protein